MTFDKWKLKDFLTIDEVARRLSEESKDDTKVSWSDVLSLALDGHLPLVVKIPPLTFVYPQEAPKDGRRPTIEGIWSLVMEGQRGSSARRSIDHSYRRLADLPPANAKALVGYGSTRRRTLVGYGSNETENNGNWIRTADCLRRCLRTRSRCMP